MKRCTLILFILFILSSGASGMDLENPVFRGGMLFLGNSDVQTAPSPLLTTVGVSLPMRFSEYILLEPGLQFHGTWYGFSEERPVPIQYERRESRVLSVLIDPAFRVEVPLSEKVRTGLSVSPGIVLRFPLVVYEDVHDGDVFDRAAALDYFFSAGRFFYPRAGLYLSWQATENVLLRVAFDSWFPLYHAWEGGAFLDGLMLCGWAGLSWKLPAK